MINGTNQTGIVLNGAGAATAAIEISPYSALSDATEIRGLGITGFTIAGIFVSKNQGSGIVSIHDNVIHDNAGAGVKVDGVPSPSRVSILGNSIYANGGLGIDLGPVGVTTNDSGDTDAGSNNLQNFPVLSSANGTTITGTLNSTAIRNFTLQFFAGAVADGSGYGEGQTYLGETMVGTGGLGDASFSFPYTPVSGQTYITATATDPNGNTSEFSAAILQVIPVTTVWVNDNWYVETDVAPLGLMSTGDIVSNLTKRVPLHRPSPARFTAPTPSPPSTLASRAFRSAARSMCWREPTLRA